MLLVEQVCGLHQGLGCLIVILWSKILMAYEVCIEEFVQVVVVNGGVSHLV